MTKRESDDAIKAAAYNIDAAFDILRTALANPAGLAHLPSGATIVPIPTDDHDPEVSAANRHLIDTLAAQGQDIVTPRVVTAQVTITPDGGLFIGQTYFTPEEAAEVGRMIQIADRPMPGTIGIEFTSDGHVIAVRPFFKGQPAGAIDPAVLGDHPEIPRMGDDLRSPVPANTFEKLNGVVTSVPAYGNRR